MKKIIFRLFVTVAAASALTFILSVWTLALFNFFGYQDFLRGIIFTNDIPQNPRWWILALIFFCFNFLFIFFEFFTIKIKKNN